MGYEAREDARSEYISQILRENYGINSSDEHIADAIESGDFDTEVLDRTIKIVQNLGVGDLGLVRSLKELQKEANL